MRFNIKKLFSILLFGVILSVYLSSVFSFSSRAFAERVPKTVKVGYYQNEVFEDGARDGAAKKGYAYEYYRKISEYTGWNYEYVYGEFATIYQMLLNGDVDLVAGLAYTEERAPIIYYPARPMGFESYGLVKHENDDSITQDTSTLRGRTIGVLDSAIVTILDEWLAKEQVHAKVIAYSDYETLMTAFDRKELDVVAAEMDGIYDRYHAEVINTFGENDYYLCVNKKRPDLLKELNIAQNQLYVDNPDYISNLRNKYYPSTLSSRAFNKSEIEWLQNHDHLTIGYLNDFLPYSDTDKEGNPTGMVTEVFSLTFKQLGVNNIEFSYKGYDSYTEIISAIAAGEIDVAFPVGGGLFYSEEDGILISEPVVSTLTDLVYNTNIKDNSPIEFAVNDKNRLQYYYVKNNFPNAIIKQYPSLEDCLNAVKSGEASYTLLNGLRTGIVLKGSHLDELSFIQLSYEDDSCFGVKIGNNGLLMLLNRGINIIGRDYQSMAFRYSQNLNSYTLMDFAKKYYWFLFVIVIIIGLIVMYALIRDVQNSKRRIAEKEMLQLEIEKANHQKFVFMNRMANYLSLPMRNLTNTLQLAQNSKDSDKISDYIGEMGSYCREMTDIISNILNMSRFESGQIKIEDKNILRRFRGKRLLIVEDTMQNQMVTGKILKKLGFEIQCASNGEEAFEKLYAAPERYFDAIIMDKDLAKNDVAEAVESIRNIDNPAKAEIPIVVISSNSGDVPESDGSIYTDYHFSKPYDINEMTDVFTRIFSN